MVLGSRRRKIYLRNTLPGQGTIPPVRDLNFDETRPNSEIEEIVEKQISSTNDEEDSIVE